MPVIACKLGFTQQVVGGATYSFNFDEKFGAHVAHVHNLTHAACFLSVEHYKEVKPVDMAAEPEQAVDTPKPKRGKKAKAVENEPPKQPEQSEPDPEQQESHKDDA